MSIAQAKRRLVIVKVGHAFKGFGRAFAVKKYGATLVRVWCAQSIKTPKPRAPLAGGRRRARKLESWRVALAQHNAATRPVPPELRRFAARKALQP